VAGNPEDQIDFRQICGIKRLRHRPYRFSAEIGVYTPISEKRVDSGVPDICGEAFLLNSRAEGAISTARIAAAPGLLAPAVTMMIVALATLWSHPSIQ
jgi:hypothetical protein